METAERETKSWSKDSRLTCVFTHVFLQMYSLIERLLTVYALKGPRSWVTSFLHKFAINQLKIVRIHPRQGICRLGAGLIERFGMGPK